MKKLIDEFVSIYKKYLWILDGIFSVFLYKMDKAGDYWCLILIF